MNPESIAASVAGGLIVLRWLVELGLNQLNRRHTVAHSQVLPEAFSGVMDAATYQKSIRYTLARLRFDQFEITADAAVLLLVLFSGALPWLLGQFQAVGGNGVWTMSGYLLAAGFALSLVGMPMAWLHQFRLEENFGFNTTTQRTWWLDRLKGFLLGLGLGLPLLALILKIVAWTGSRWWLWAWGAWTLFQLVMLVLAPVLILPLFNKFSPLPEGTLRDRLLELARRTGFRARSIQVMDGSKRSRHSNAFFTGFGRFRKVVLYDTLIQQLSEAELEAVLAHEIGHYRLRHVPKMMAVSLVASLAGFWILAWLARQEWFPRAFGFGSGDIVAVLLLFALLSGTLTFWFSPLANWWSRRHEYEADAFAARAMNEGRPLMTALRKLSEKNLSHLTPHPLYSGFHYSHPTLLERETALRKADFER